MCSCLESNKVIFTKNRVGRAISKLLCEEYDSKLMAKSPENCRPCVLYNVEIKLILQAVNSPCPTTTRDNFWISSSWVANCKLYYEALPLPDTGITTKKSTPSKKMKIRARRGSEALPPWPMINCEITCGHEALASSKGIRAKRRIIERKHWQLLRKFFPQGEEFKGSAPECGECTVIKEPKPVTELKSRYIDENGLLYPVFMRKSGVPSHCLTIRDEVESAFGIHMLRPLLPGLYVIVPKDWLRAWRQFIKDASIPSPPMFDSSSVLCEEHGFLMVPPHVEEYLVGLRKSLLSNLGEYEGEVMEILTTEEFAALQREKIKGMEDFHVCFSCDGDGLVQWNIEKCNRCDHASVKLSSALMRSPR